MSASDFEFCVKTARVIRQALKHPERRLIDPAATGKQLTPEKLDRMKKGGLIWQDKRGYRLTAQGANAYLDAVG